MATQSSMRIGLAALLITSAVTAMHSCAPARPTLTADPEFHNRDLSQGYTLLYNLLQQNRQVDQAVRIPFRSVNDETAQLLRDISAASGEAADTLYDLIEISPTLGLDEAGLPLIEQATRESIEAQARRDLLAGPRDRFEIYLLLSQAEATRYAAHLALQLAELDSQTSRQQFMREIHDRFQQLHDRTVQRIQQQSPQQHQ